mmetsp:Transcript_15650/g.49429  ORF Transcript_15650/g.49429 Transcript_15650/m.49429 type:complete len:217 (-) Transcript_15650:176-826(-)
MEGGRADVRPRDRPRRRRARHLRRGQDTVPAQGYLHRGTALHVRHRLRLRLRLYGREQSLRRGQVARDGAAARRGGQADPLLRDGGLLPEELGQGGAHVLVQRLLAELRPRGASRHHRLHRDGAAQEKLWLAGPPPSAPRLSARSPLLLALLRLDPARSPLSLSFSFSPLPLHLHLCLLPLHPLCLPTASEARPAGPRGQHGVRHDAGSATRFDLH